jgi:hypothetical protein
MADETEMINNTQGYIVESEQPGYHETKIYNNTRDNIWDTLAILLATEDFSDIKKLYSRLIVLVERSASIWHEIEKTYEYKRSQLKVEFGDSNKNFMKQFKEFSNKLKKCLNFVEGDFDKSEYTDYEGNITDKDYREYTEATNKSAYIKNVANKTITEFDKLWGESAASLGMGPALRTREEGEIFFRDRKKAPNSVYRRRF